MPRNSIDNVQINTSISLLLHPMVYIEGLLSHDGSKTCLGMAEKLNISHDILQKIVDGKCHTENELRDFLINMVSLYASSYKKSFQIIDDTLLVKEFSYILEKLGLINKANKHDKHKGYKIVVLLWTDGQITIPIDFRIWINDGPTKVDLALQMIIENYKKIKFGIVLMDGLYPSDKMLTTLDELSIKFIMRLPKNRKIRKSKHELNAKIGDHWQYRLNRNARIKRFEGFVQGVWRYITAHKQKDRSGRYQTRYLISNFDESAQNIFNLYLFRWTIEIFFKTVKQKLGLQDCLSRSIKGQKNHIWMVLISYAIAGLIKIKKGYKTVDESIRMIRSKYSSDNYHKELTWIIFSAFA